MALGAPKLIAAYGGSGVTQELGAHCAPGALDAGKSSKRRKAAESIGNYLVNLIFFGK